MNKKIVMAIPISLAIFVMFYSTVEQNIDCPMVAYDPIGNENCEYTKSWLWHSVAVLSGTAFGLQPDGILTSVAVSPDEAEARNIFPMLILSGLTIFGVWLSENPRELKKDYRSLGLLFTNKNGKNFLEFMKYEIRKDLTIKDKRYYKSIIVVGFITFTIWTTYFLASWLPVR